MSYDLRTYSINAIHFLLVLVNVAQLRFTKATSVCLIFHYSATFFSIRAYSNGFASSCTAKHIGKSVMLHLCEGPKLRTHCWWDREKKKEKPAPSRIRTHDLKSLALQACALPLSNNRYPTLVSNLILVTWITSTGAFSCRKHLFGIRILAPIQMPTIRFRNYCSRRRRRLEDRLDRFSTSPKNHFN